MLCPVTRLKTPWDRGLQLGWVLHLIGLWPGKVKGTDTHVGSSSTRQLQELMLKAQLKCSLPPGILAETREMHRSGTFHAANSRHPPSTSKWECQTSCTMHCRSEKGNACPAGGIHVDMFPKPRPSTAVQPACVRS